MKLEIAVSLAICIAFKSASALICHDYVCDESQCYGQGNTCDSGDRPCQVLRKVNMGHETTTFTCSALATCVSTAGNTTFDGLVMNICCDTDLCNDGLGGPEFEENQKYCYNTGCAGVGCTQNLVEYIDANNIGAFCKANEYGCESTKVKHTNPETGEELAEEILGCATAPCFPINEDVDGFDVKLECCDGHLCNKESATGPDPDKDYCHVYSCLEAPCIPVHEAASKGRTNLCRMTEKGCYFSNTTYLDTGAPIVTAGCVGQTAFMDTCTPESLTIDNIQTEIHCCGTDRCNDGQKPGGTEVDPNKDYCHVYECMSHNCMSLSHAIKFGKTGLCEMTSLGCFTNTIVGEDSMIVNSGCVGQTPDVAQCIPTSMTIENTRTTTKCCTKDRCNDGEEKDVEDEIDPNKDYCHTYSCVSSPGSPCLSLSEAVEQGVSSVCEMTDKGCFESSFESENQTSILAGCAGDEHMASDCKPYSVLAEGKVTLQSCCNSDRCNNGKQHEDHSNYMGGEPFCHMYMCHSPTRDCLSVAEAIMQGKSVKCKKTDADCFYSSDGKFLNAGCLDGLSTRDPCGKERDGLKTICCDTSGCNDGLGANTEPVDFNNGSTKKSLLGFMFVISMVVCIGMLF